MKIDVERFADGPIIRPNMDARMGDNVNGPTLIEVPGWIKNPLGKYYLYFDQKLCKAPMVNLYSV